MNIIKKLFTWLILPVAIAALVYAIVACIMQPVNFNKEKDFREEIGVQRLKDIRTLQVAFKGENNRFSSTLDSLVDFYKKGEMTVTLQVGSKDDTTLDEPTNKAIALIKKSNPRIDNNGLNVELEKLYNAGNKLIRFQKVTKVPVSEALEGSLSEGFVADSIKFIPFSGGKAVEMTSISKLVSGVQVPLFEAKMAYRDLLKGLDNQLRINLDAERRDQNKYEGLQVGSISAPNNNAGNWE